MGIYRDGIGRVRRIKVNRNVRRLHLQCQVTKGGALPAAEERSLRKRLARLFKLERLTGRRYERIISKRTRRVK